MPLFGPRWPLKKGNEDAFEMYDDVNDQISYYLRCLLLTSPGENISDPSYGIGLRQYLFEQNLDSTRGTMLSNIYSQIGKFLPYLDIQDIQVTATDAEINSNSLRLTIIYYIPSDTTQQVFELDLNPDTTIGFY